MLCNVAHRKRLKAPPTRGDVNLAATAQAVPFLGVLWAIGAAVCYDIWPDQLWILLASSLVFGVLVTAFSSWALVSNSRYSSRPWRAGSSAWQYAAHIVLTSMALGCLAGGVLALAGILAVTMWAFAVPYAQELTAWLYGMTGKRWMIIAAGLLTAAIGGLFFVFRLRQRFLYGATESLAGMVIAGYRFSAEPGGGIPSETEFYLAVLTAGIYLVVRGLDNMREAIKAGDPLSTWAIARLMALSGIARVPGKPLHAFPAPQQEGRDHAATD